MTSDFVAALYEAALEPEGLRSLIKLVGNYLGVNGMAASLVDECLLTDAALNQELAASQRAYLDHYDDCNACNCETRVTSAVSLGAGASTAIASAVCDRPGVADCGKNACTMGAAAAIAMTGIRLVRAEHLPSQDHSGPLQAILPHLRHALQLRQRGRQTSAAPQSLAVSALAALAFGTLICDGEGRIAYANPVAEALALHRIGVALKSRDRSIMAVVPAEAVKLALIIQAAATANRPGSILLTGRDGSNCLMVVITPLRAQDGGGTPGQVLLALRQVGSAPSFDVARLTELFRLSPAQAILAIGLYEGKSFEEIAVERGVKVTTLRTHFAEVLSRTGSRSLRDLVRLLGSIPPLLKFGSRTPSQQFGWQDR